MKIEIIDDFLPLNVFDGLHKFLLSTEDGGQNIGWAYSPNVNYARGYVEKTPGKENWRLFYLTHLVYKHVVLSPLYEKIRPLLEPLNIKALIRIKLNMYPNTEILKEHGMHTDFDYSHKIALLSINTCNGYTKLEDGTKIDSIANRMLLFDGSTLHSSTTCTDQPVRVNININYL
jgi:hypothetical protein